MEVVDKVESSGRRGLEEVPEKKTGDKNVIIRLYDDNIEFQTFLIVREKDAGTVEDLLDKYRSSKPGEYDNVGFFKYLDSHKIKYEHPKVRHVYF